MAPEPASAKQRHYLQGLLKARGVREGDCQALIDAVYPHGLSKSQASAEIDKMKYLNGLPARWIHTYVRELRRHHELPVDRIVEHLEVAFDGATQPAGLSRLQQQELIEWICNRDRPSRSETSPQGRREENQREARKETGQGSADLSGAVPNVTPLNP
jgi:hypothetical protein